MKTCKLTTFLHIRLVILFFEHNMYASGFSVSKQLDAVARDCKDMLDNPTLRSLRHALQQEVGVMRAAYRGQKMKSRPNEDMVAILLELRTSLNGWNAPRNGEVGQSILESTV